MSFEHFDGRLWGVCGKGSTIETFQIPVFFVDKGRRSLSSDENNLWQTREILELVEEKEAGNGMLGTH